MSRITTTELSADVSYENENQHLNYSFRSLEVPNTFQKQSLESSAVVSPMLNRKRQHSTFDIAPASMLHNTVYGVARQEVLKNTRAVSVTSRNSTSAPHRVSAKRICTSNEHFNPKFSLDSLLDDDDDLLTSQINNLEQCVAHATADVAEFLFDNENVDYECGNEFNPVVNDYMNCIDGTTVQRGLSMEDANVDQTLMMMEVAILAQQNDLRLRKIEWMQKMMMKMNQRRHRMNRRNSLDDSQQRMLMFMNDNSMNPLSYCNSATRRMSYSERAQSRRFSANCRLNQPIMMMAQLEEQNPIEIGKTLVLNRDNDDVSVLTMPSEICTQAYETKLY